MAGVDPRDALPEQVAARAVKPLSTARPTPEDLRRTDKLRELLDQVAPLEGKEEKGLREVVLVRLGRLVREWVTAVCMSKGLSEALASEAGGKLVVSGSYRLGVNEPGGDIDVVCVAPRLVTRDDFFDTLYQRLKECPECSFALPVATARVPLIEIIFSGVNIDLLFAMLPLPTVPESLNLLDDSILKGVDEATQISLNGPRVTNMIVRLVPDYEAFVLTLRAIRLWGNRRGLYSNKMGFFGGVNYAIVVAYVCRLYPHQTPSVLVHHFFALFQKWSWPKPVTLVEPYNCDVGLRVWDQAENQRQVMPILTPAYPASNSTFNATRSTLSIIREEFERGMEQCSAIFKDTTIPWERLFEPSEFFLRYDYYMLVIVSALEEDADKWYKWIESRLRKLVECLENERLPLRSIYPFPQKFEPPKSATGYKDYWYYVGLEVDRDSKKFNNNPAGKTLDLSNPTVYFINSFARNWAERKETMNIDVQVLDWKNLPVERLAPLTREEAAEKRSQIRKARKKYIQAKREEFLRRKSWTNPDAVLAAVTKPAAPAPAASGSGLFLPGLTPSATPVPAEGAPTAPSDDDSGSEATPAAAPAAAGAADSSVASAAAVLVPTDNGDSSLRGVKRPVVNLQAAAAPSATLYQPPKKRIALSIVPAPAPVPAGTAAPRPAVVPVAAAPAPAPAPAPVPPPPVSSPTLVSARSESASATTTAPAPAPAAPAPTTPA